LSSCCFRHSFAANEGSVAPRPKWIGDDAFTPSDEDEAKVPNMLYSDRGNELQSGRTPKIFGFPMNRRRGRAFDAMQRATVIVIVHTKQDV